MNEDNYCEAMKTGYMHSTYERCQAQKKVEVNKKNLCIVHAKQEALSVLLKSGKAKRIYVPVPIKEVDEPVLTYKEYIKQKEEKHAQT